MKAVNSLTLLLIIASLMGYIALSIWFMYKNEQNKTNRTLWVFLILGIPFVGSTFCFLKYFIASDIAEVYTKNTP